MNGLSPEFISSVRSLAQRDKLGQGLQELASFLRDKDPNLYFLACQLQLQHTHFQQQASQGLISSKALSGRNNAIRQRLADVLQELEAQLGSESPAKARLLSEPGQMVWIEGGPYLGSNPERHQEEKPSHAIEVQSFSIDKYQVSNTQYADFLNQYGSDEVKAGPFKGQKMIFPHKWGVARQDNIWRAADGYDGHPVIWVTWYGANEYARYYGLRLPTEAEWEYAANGARERLIFDFSGSSDPDEVAWMEKNSGGYPHATGRKKANDLGLYDMSGNVFEWCGNHSNSSPPPGKYKAIRGGAWNSPPEDCRIDTRKWFDPGFRFNNIGFRCAGSRYTMEN